MWNKFKNWLIKFAIKGKFVAKGRAEAHKIIDKIFNELENKIK